MTLVQTITVIMQFIVLILMIVNYRDFRKTRARVRELESQNQELREQLK